MTQITNRDLHGMFRRAIAAARELGLETSSWELHSGSVTNGITYKLLSQDPTRLDLGGWGQEHLGHTKREAYDKLQALAQAWEAARAARPGPVRPSEETARAWGLYRFDRIAALVAAALDEARLLCADDPDPEAAAVAAVGNAAARLSDLRPRGLETVQTSGEIL